METVQANLKVTNRPNLSVLQFKIHQSFHPYTSSNYKALG